MLSLNAITARESLDAPEFYPDHFQARVLESLHLEFFFARCRFLITPNFAHITTGEAMPAEEAQLRPILAQRQGVLGELKQYLIHSLAAYSALLEANSYHIAVNDHLVIARFVDNRAHPEGFEVKLYTLRPEDLPGRYTDKIYLGRDLLRLDGRRRDHFGLRFLRDSLREQVQKLVGRLEQHAPEGLKAALERDFLEDIQEEVEDAVEKADEILARFPASPPPARAGDPALLELNAEFRELKHRLLEIDEALEGLEAELLEHAPRAARYATKFRKDVTNAVSFVMMKVNCRISDAVNGIGL
jgi:hypothetical protein